MYDQVQTVRVWNDGLIESKIEIDLPLHPPSSAESCTPQKIPSSRALRLRERQFCCCLRGSAIAEGPLWQFYGAFEECKHFFVGGF
jgi:hypothetical protein